MRVLLPQLVHVRSIGEHDCVVLGSRAKPPAIQYQEYNRARSIGASQPPRSISPGLLSAIVVEVVLAGITQGHFGLTPVDAFPGAIAIAVAVPACVLGAIGVAATLTADVEEVGTIIPSAQPFFVIAPLGLLTSLDLGCLGGFLLQLVAVGRAAETADGRLDVAVPGTEVAATDDTLGRRGTETYCDWTCSVGAYSLQ